MIEIGIFSLIVIYCTFSKPNDILYLLLFLLPFHTFLKNCFSYFQGGGNIFAFWKEFAVLILFLKVISKPHFKFDKGLLGMILGFLIIVIAFFFLNSKPQEAIATLRDHISPLILLSAMYCLPIQSVVAKKALGIFTVAVFINCIMGFVQYFFLKIQIATIMGSIDFIDSSGYIQYKQDSARILGIERMSGIVGGPNLFGVFYSFVVVFLFGNLLVSKRLGISKRLHLFILVTLILSCICLIFSFSRAGWVIAGIGGGICLHMSNIKTKSQVYTYGSLAIAFLLFLVVYFFPFVGDVFYDSITGNEASAADRGNNFARGLSKNLLEPFGHGLGTTDNRHKTEFFAESAFLNIIYEIGFLGFAYLFAIHCLFITYIYKFRFNGFRPFANMAIAISAPTLLVCFVSINPYAIPFIYLWWMVIGLGLNRSDLNLANSAIDKSTKSENAANYMVL